MASPSAYDYRVSAGFSRLRCPPAGKSASPAARRPGMAGPVFAKRAGPESVGKMPGPFADGPDRKLAGPHADSTPPAVAHALAGDKRSSFRSRRPVFLAH